MKSNAAILLHFFREAIPFRFLPPKQLESLCSELTVAAAETGTVINSFKSGSVLLLLEGSILVYHDGECSSSLTESTSESSKALELQEGQFYGEWEAVFETGMCFRLIAQSDVRYSVINHRAFLQLIRDNTPFAQAFASIFRDKRGIFQAFDRFRAELRRGIAFGHIEIDDLLDLYRQLEPALHPFASDEQRLDPGALTYAVRRLPLNITRTFALLLRDELPEVFDNPGQYLREIATPARRRSVWEVLPGKDLVLLRSGLSDLTDLITCLCLYSTEAGKLRRRIYQSRGFTRMKTWLDDPGNFISDGSEDTEAAKNLLGELGFTKRETDAVVSIWPGSTIHHLQDVGLHREMYTIDIRRQLSSHISHRTEVWTSQIVQAVVDLIGVDPGEMQDDRCVHIISSNTHSVTNCLNPWYRERSHEIMEWAVRSGHSVLDFEWKHEEDMLYAMGRDFLNSSASERSLHGKRLTERGIVSLPGTLETGIEVQVIDLARAFGDSIDSRLAGKYSGNDIVINIDYAFGEQAEHILRSLILLFHRNLRSVNFLGKAGALTGKRGDVLIPRCFMHQLDDEVQQIIEVPERALARIRSAVGEDSLHYGPMITVEGTLLQNRTMLHYYRNLWQAVGLEMEGAYYHHQVLESQRTGLLSGDISQRYFYYVSDLPLGQGHNLSQPMAAAEGVPPLYACTIEVLKGIGDL